MMKKITYLALTLVATGLTACANSPENGVSNNTNVGQAQCLPAEAKKLVGHTGLSDEQIKQKTGSKIVRTLTPNQPATMDYRIERITVIIDPVTNQIKDASCG